MRERHVHASGTAEDFDLRIEVLRERLDEGRALTAAEIYVAAFEQLSHAP